MELFNEKYNIDDSDDDINDEIYSINNINRINNIKRKANKRYCRHLRPRSRCNECGTGCIHNRAKNYCFECGTGKCVHNRSKYSCSICKAEKEKSKNLEIKDNSEKDKIDKSKKRKNFDDYTNTDDKQTNMYIYASNFNVSKRVFDQNVKHDDDLRYKLNKKKRFTND